MGVQVFEPGIQTISAGTTWTNGPGISFANANNVSFGIIGETITASANVSAAALAIAAGTQTATSGTIVFSNANGVTFGMNASTVTASVAGGGGAGTPITVFSQWGGFETNYSVSRAQISYQKVSIPMAVSGASGIYLADVSGHSSASGAITISIGAYRLTGSTASSLTTASASFSWTTGSDTTAATVYGGASGTRYRSFGWANSLTAGDYLFAVAVYSAGDAGIRLFGRQGVKIVGTFAGAETAYFLDGVSGATSGAFPASIHATETGYIRTGLSAVQQPGFILIGTI